MALKKFFVTAALILAILVGVVTATALTLPAQNNAAEASGHSHPICGKTHTDIGDHTGDCASVVWTAWDGTTEITYDENNVAYVYLSSNVELEQLEIANGMTLYFCLNGHSLISTKDDAGDSTHHYDATVYVSDTSKFILCDCVGGGKITHKDGLRGRGVLCGKISGDSPVFKMFGGEISGNRVGTEGGDKGDNGVDGGGVEVIQGTFTMYGGKIRDNHVIQQFNYGGGGIHLQSNATFNMYGGEISDNSSAHRGGGIAAAISNAINIYGGTISNNSAATQGGGIYAGNVSLYLYGGTISNNSAEYGGGVYFYSSRTYDKLYVQSPTGGDDSASVSITDNSATADGGGIYNDAAKSSFIIEKKCEVLRNTATGNGGGIYVNGTSNFSISGATNSSVSYNTAANGGGIYVNDARTVALFYGCKVSNNTAANNGGGLYLNSEQSSAVENFQMNGCTVSENTAKVDGGGIYVNKGSIGFILGNVVEGNTVQTGNGGGVYYGTECTEFNICGTPSIKNNKKGDVANNLYLTQGKYVNTTGVWQESSFVGVTTEATPDSSAYVLIATCDDAAYVEDIKLAYDNDSVNIYTITNDSSTIDFVVCVHNYGSTYLTDEESHWQECSFCHNKTTAVAHSGGTATCTEKARCSTCNAQYGEVLGHRWDNGTITTQPDCTHTGIRTFNCTRTNCTETKTETEAALGHDTEEHEAKAPTCTEIGWDAYVTCSRCDYTTYSEKEPIGHDFSEAWTTDLEPTCTVKGSKSHHCTHAGCSETTGVTEIAALGHTEEIDEAVAATCTKTGLTAGKHCSVCEATLVAQTVTPKIAHTEVTDAAVAATCTTTGLTAGKHCSVCNEITVAQTVTPKIAHTEVTDAAVAATCTSTGLTAGKHCSVCNEITVAQTVTPKIAHTEEIDAAVAATCTTTGLTEGSHCSVCNAVLEAQTIVAALGHSWDEGETTTAPDCLNTGVKTYKCNHTGCTEEKTEIVPALGHKEVIDAEIPATCTSTGLTIGKHCSVCNAITAAREVIDKKAHTEVVDKAKSATCTETGLTEGKHCSACNEILVAQEVISKKAHTEVIDKAKTATCTETGLTEGKHCSECNEILVAQEVVAKKAHTEVIDKAKTATCTETGLSEGKHCSVCNEILVAQEIVNKVNHTEELDEAVAPTCTQSGLTAGSHCSVCHATLEAQTVIPALGHNEVTDEAVAPTCTTDGKTEGSHCSECNAIFVAQQTIPAHGHSWNDGEVTTAPDCTHTGVKTFTCTVDGCDGTRTETINALGHDHSETWTVDKPATCTEKGSKSHHCSRCDDKADITEIPANGHSWDDGEVTTAPDCLNTGVKTFHCTVDGCDGTDTETITALGHDYSAEWSVDEAATCTEKGSKSHHCTRCDDKKDITEIPANGHTEVIDEAVAATCTADGKTAGKHCSVCDEIIEAQTVIPATGHVYDDDYDATCNVCGYTRTPIKIVPEIVEGRDGQWNMGQNNDLTFTTNVDDTKFVGITIDGVEVDAANYATQDDGKKIVFKPEFLKTLPVGEHTLSVISEDGTVETAFTIVARAAETQAKDYKLLWLLVIPMVAVTALIVVLIVKYSDDRKRS